jgi:hypothetical protein
MSLNAGLAGLGRGGVVYGEWMRAFKKKYGHSSLKLAKVMLNFQTI